MPVLDEPNAELYPVSHAFVSTINDHINRVDPPAYMVSFTLEDIAKVLAEVIGEYEHGVADVRDATSRDDLDLTTYSEVALDLFLSLRNRT